MMRAAMPKAVLLMLLLAGVAQVAHARPSPFDHFGAGFELMGRHAEVDCESCHVNGVFEGTPRVCEGCHDGTGLRAETAKPKSHARTSEDCGACHVTASWEAVAYVDHEETIGACVECHNGFFAGAKPANHPPSSDDCASCHNTFTWSETGFDHAGIVDGCSRCHNGTDATGKPGGHISTDDVCEACHTTQRWDPVVMVDHDHVYGTCSTCHDGVRAEGKH